jgi:glycosyltransferase involved in cell wall biosynthesis
MRVTHLTASGEMGGAERVILECIAVGDGWPGAESSVVAFGPGSFLTAAERLGARTTVVEAPPALAGLGDAFASSAAVIRGLVRSAGTFPMFFRRVSKAVAGLAPQVIHSHAIKTHVVSALLPRRALVIWHLHDYIGSRSLSSRLLRLLAHRCSLAIAVSESVAEDARRWLPSGVPLAVVHNSVDCGKFSPEGRALDLDALSALPPAPRDTVRIGLPATFARWKGHDVFLEALARIDDPRVRAYIIGAPVYRTHNSQWSRAELEAKVKALGLEGKVGFAGPVSDMPAAYRALDIVVHASTRPEPFGLVIAEAMACGRAVIVAPTGGAGELFVDDTHALAAASGSAAEMTVMIQRLVDSPRKRAELGMRAREHVVHAFGRDRFGADLNAVLSRVSDSHVEAEQVLAR